MKITEVQVLISYLKKFYPAMIITFTDDEVSALQNQLLDKRRDNLLI